jgi:hypothetical protein
MRRLKWKSLGGVDYTLTIEDVSASVVDLVAGASPFTTNIDDSDDVWEPIRIQSGNIQIEGDVDDLIGLVDGKPASRRVHLSGMRNGSSIGVCWVGFLQTTAYSQAWDKGPLTIDIPVVSPLGVLQGFYPSSAIADLTYINFAQFLINMNNCIGGTSLYENFIFPKLTNPAVTLGYNFDMRNFAEKVSYGNYRTESYRDILEEICKFFGWQCQEKGDALVFLAVDSTSGYIRMTKAQLETKAHGGAAHYTNIDDEVIDNTINGAEHQIDYVDGRKKVEVVGNVNPYEENLWELNIDDYDINATYGDSKVNGTDREYFYTRCHNNQKGVTVSDPGGNFRYENWLAGTTGYEGCCLVSERLLLAPARPNATPEWDTKWNGSIMFHFTTANQGVVFATILAELPYRYTTFLQNRYIRVKMHIRKSPDIFSDLEDFTDMIKLRVSVGSTVAYQGLARVKNGEVIWTAHAGVGLADGFNVKCPTVNGTLKIELMVPNQSEWPPYDYSAWYSITELSISYANDWTRNLLSSENKENKETREIGGGFEEEYHSECQLTTYKNGEFGSGVVLGTTVTDTIPTELYNNKSAEDALAGRVAAYFEESKKELVVEVRKPSTMLNSFHRHRLVDLDGNAIDSTAYVCISQRVDWANDTLIARMCEF